MTFFKVVTDPHGKIVIVYGRGGQSYPEWAAGNAGSLCNSSVLTPGFEQLTQRLSQNPSNTLALWGNDHPPLL